jgi:protein SCO1/2
MSSDPAGSPEPAAPARIPRLGWAVAFVAATVVITAAYMQFRSAIDQRRGGPQLERLAEAPDFKLTAQDGSLVTKNDLKGKVWVANFIFTRCLGPCPMMTSRMAELNQRLSAKAKDVQLVSFTVDPEYDTPSVLSAYGEKVGAVPPRWRFLTGPKGTMTDVVTKGFLQALGSDPAGMPEHSTRFVVVDRDGWMRKFQDGNDPELVQKLLMDIGDILREPSDVKKQ